MKWEDTFKKGFGLLEDLKLLVKQWKPETEEGRRYKADLEDVIFKYEEEKRSSREPSFWDN